MYTLFPHVPFDPIETPLSFAIRLAALHTGGPVLPFLTDIGVRSPELLSGNVSAINRLASMAGETPEKLLRNTAVCVSKRCYDLRGSLISAEFMSRPATVFCPACRHDDIRSGSIPGGHRSHWSWTLSAVRTCLVHGIPLIARPITKGIGELQWATDGVPEDAEELEALVDASTTRKVSALQSYVLDRLAGRSGPSWLDGQTLDQAWRATEMLGVVLVFGPDKNLLTTTQNEWDKAGCAGYAFTSKGEAGICAALSEIHAARPNLSGGTGPQKVFGRLFQWLAYSKNAKEPGDIKRIVRDYIMGNFPLSEGHKVFGVSLPARRLHTATSLAFEAKLDSRTLRNLLIARDLIPAEEADNPNFPFDAESGRKIAAAAQRTVTVIALPAALNSTRPQADQLLAERLITQIGGDKLDGTGHICKAIDAELIDIFLMRLEDCAEGANEVRDDLVSISKAAEKARASSAEIIHLILGGFLKNVVRKASTSGISAIYVDADEVKIAARTILIGLDAASAFGKLRIPVASGWALAMEHPEELRSIQVSGPNGVHSFARFMPEDIARFAGKFTTSVIIANRRGVEKKVVLGEFKRAGVNPIFRHADFGISLYRTRDVPALEPI